MRFGEIAIVLNQQGLDHRPTAAHNHSRLPFDLQALQRQPQSDTETRAGACRLFPNAKVNIFSSQAMRGKCYGGNGDYASYASDTNYLFPGDSR